MEKHKITVYKNGAVIRMHNRRVVIYAQDDDTIVIEAKRFIGFNQAETTAVRNKYEKGIMTNGIAFSKDATLLIAKAIMEYFAFKYTDEQ